MASYGEDVVMILFIFFVFADPIDGFTGIYQLEYAATTAAELSTIRHRYTAESNCEPESGAKFCRTFQNDGSTRTAVPTTTTATTTSTTAY